MKVLVLEASTTSAKAMLYDSSNGKYKVRTKAYANIRNDVTKHDAEYVYWTVCEVSKVLTENEQVDIIALSGTWHSIFLADKHLQAKTPVLLWSNTEAKRIAKEYRKNIEYLTDYYHKTGCMTNAIYPYFKLLYFKQQGYELQDYYILGQGDLITYKLTSKLVTTACLASGTGLLNIHHKEYCPHLLGSLQINESNLPSIVSSYTSYPLTQAGAKDLGLKTGIPVLPCNSDGGLNQLGSGALNPGVMTFSLGTSGAMRLSTTMPLIPEKPSTWCYLSPNGWLSGAATNGGCNSIDWFVQSVALNKYDYDELELAPRKIDAPIFLPFQFGERCPGWDDERTGGFTGILPDTTIYDLYQAVQEGVLFNLYQCYKVLELLNGTPKHIRFSGGILNSNKWSQMCADILQQDLEVSINEHSSLLGGVILAINLLNEDSKQITSQLTDPVRIIRPNLSYRDFYLARFNKYLESYNLIINN